MPSESPQLDSLGLFLAWGLQNQAKAERSREEMTAGTGPIAREDGRCGSSNMAVVPSKGNVRSLSSNMPTP